MSLCTGFLEVANMKSEIITFQMIYFSHLNILKFKKHKYQARHLFSCSLKEFSAKNKK